MSKFFERSPIVLDNPEDKKPYDQYWKLGGIINEKDYDSALTRAKNITAFDKTRTSQAEGMAKFAGIELQNKDAVDQRIILYGILRSDVRPKEGENHHSQMSDQKIFTEALRMLGDAESVDKMIKAYPNISFKYREEEKDEKEYKKAA